MKPTPIRGAVAAPAPASFNAEVAAVARARRKLDLLQRVGCVAMHDRLLEPGKPWRIDHLLITPTGVRMVVVVTWPGTVRITPDKRLEITRPPLRGQSRIRDKSDAVKRLRGIASYATARLGQPVTPLLVLGGVKSRTFKGPVEFEGVTLISIDDLYDYLRGSIVGRNRATVPVPQVAQVAKRKFPPAPALDVPDA